MDNFTQIPFTPENLDCYYIRSSIFKALKEVLPHFSGKLLDFGCGKMPYKKYILELSNIDEYVGVDIETHLDYKGTPPDFTWDGQCLPFMEESFDAVMATEVFEHVPAPERSLEEIFRIMKPGATFFFTVPFLWPLHEVPYDEYRYTPFSLERILVAAGFKEIQISPSGGWDASLAQMLGLWLRKRPLGHRKREFLSRLFCPLIHYLIKKDLPPTNFNEGCMIPGLSGICIKT